MLRTVKIARKGEPSVASTGKDSARLGILRRSTSGFTSLDAKAVANHDEDSGADFEELPPMSDVIKRRGGVREKDVAQNERCDEEEETDSRSAEDEEEGDEDDGERDEEEYEIHDEESVLDREDQDSGDVQEQPEDDVGDCEDEQHNSENESDEESCSVNELSHTAAQRGSSKGRRVTIDWNESEDTRKLLEKLEEFAMRDQYVGFKNGTWRNNVFGEVSKMLGKPGETCSNRYTRLKHKYLDIMKVLGLGVGLIWDAKSNEVRGPKKSWKQVVDAELVKLRGQKFLYKEEFDNLNELLNLVPPPKAKTSGKQPAPARPTAVLQSRVESDGRGGEDSPPNVDDDRHDEVAENGEGEGQNSGDEYAQSEAELTKSPSSPLNTRRRAQMAEASVNNREGSDRGWFDIASIHELVRLLLEYVQDDYYISPISKAWKNGVFKEIAVKIGKDQKRCQWKYMSLRHAYMEIEKLLSSNFGFEWDPERHEVVGSNEAWARVKSTNLTRHRRSKFLSRDEFAKLAEKLNFEWREDAYQNRKRDRKRERTSARTARSQPSYAEFPDEIEQSADGDEDQDEGDTVGHACTPPGKKRLFSETREKHGPVVEDHHDESDGVEEAHEPPRKRRLLSDTYEKRREAFYVAAARVSAKREALKAMFKAQLAIQHHQVAIHKEQIAALHAQLTVETKLSKSFEDCHLKDTLRRDTLEGLRSTAHSRLQHETYLTPFGKLIIMRTLSDLRSKAEGYLGVMFLDPVIRNLWLKFELEKLATGEPSKYFIDKSISKSHNKGDTTEALDEDSGFTLVVDGFELELNKIDAAEGACENDDSGVGVHFNGDSCSSDHVEAGHAPRDERVQEEQPVGNDDQGAEADPFEIDPYIFVEERQGKDVLVKKEAGRNEAADAFRPADQKVEAGGVADANNGSLPDDTLLQD